MQIHVYDSKVTSDPTGNSLSLLPIARGHVAADGTVKAATDNVTVSKILQQAVYDIVIANEDINQDDYSIIATVNNASGFNSARVIYTEVISSNYEVTTAKIDATKIDSDFSFIIYKDN